MCAKKKSVRKPMPKPPADKRTKADLLKEIKRLDEINTELTGRAAARQERINLLEYQNKNTEAALKDERMEHKESKRNFGTKLDIIQRAVEQRLKTEYDVGLVRDEEMVRGSFVSMEPDETPEIRFLWWLGELSM